MELLFILAVYINSTIILLSLPYVNAVVKSRLKHLRAQNAVGGCTDDTCLQDC
jgi:hypothetical protein